MTKRAAEALASGTAKLANVKTAAPKPDAVKLDNTEIDYSKLPLSTFPVPRISEQRNVELERIYLESQKKFKPKNNSWERCEPNPNSTRKPKKQIALLMSYCGVGYQGMQINPSVPTIELDLFKALAESGAVSVDNQMDAAKFNFQRCARTDKGVIFLIGPCCWPSCFFKNDFGRWNCREIESIFTKTNQSLGLFESK